MTRQIFILILLLTSTVSLFGKTQPTITYRHSKMVGVVRLIDSMASLGAASEALKIIHNRAFEKDEKTEAIVSAVKKECIPRGLFDRVYALASTSKDKEELKFLVYGLRKNEGSDERPFIALMEAIDHFTPRYEKLLHAASGPLNGLLSHLRSKKMKRLTNGLVRKTVRFYGADLPITNIDVVLVPLYGLRKKEKRTRSQSFGPFQLIEVVLPSKEFTQYGVVIHEIAHYCQRHSSPLEQAFAQMSQASTLYGSMLKHSIFNETMATAIGNGYGERMAGLKWSERWYEDETYDKYAKAMYELTKQYLEENKELDEKFTDRSLKTFEQLFPNIHRKPEKVFRSIFLATQGMNSREVSQLFSKEYGGNDINLSSPIAHRFTREGFDKCGPRTRVFVLPAKEMKSLLDFPELDYGKLVKLTKGNDSFLLCKWSNEQASYLVTIIAKDCRETRKLMKKVFAKPLMTEGLYLP